MWILGRNGKLAKKKPSLAKKHYLGRKMVRFSGEKA
jgi:hypothetical protein